MAASSRTHRAGWYDAAWKHRREIVIDRTKVSGADQRDFPVMISFQDAAFKGVAEGGRVARSHGEDLLFASSDGVTRLDHELEMYDPATGALKAWVRVSLLSHTADTVLYLYSGNPAGSAGQNSRGVWSSSYKMVLHLNGAEGSQKDSTAHRNDGAVHGGKGQNGYVQTGHSDSLNITEAITVEAWVEGRDPRAEVFQALVSRWSLLSTLNTFEAYDAGDTDGLNTKGFFGAVFDGRYVYFVPQYDGEDNHGRVLRYDTRGKFDDPGSWGAYDAGHTSGLDTRGYYGAVAAGRYIYFVPRLAGRTGAFKDSRGWNHHSRVLRYDRTGAFKDPKSWSAFDAGNPVSYQSAAYDGRYIYFSPGYEGKTGPSGKTLRYDTHGDFAGRKSYITYDAENTSNLNTKGYDGAVFDGRYVYFAPLEPVGIPLRYDTHGDFSDPVSWTAYDAGNTSGLRMGQCVGAIFDGTYVYFVPYANSVAVRYDTRGDFCDAGSWAAHDAGCASGLKTKGYDGAAFDGRYIYFIPFREGEKDISTDFHGKLLRFDTQVRFTDENAWTACDAGDTSGLRAVGFNGGAFDGRYIYFAPWREGTHPDGTARAHGRVLRYDTTGSNASFSLRYMDCGHNGGLCAALPGPSFLVNTDRGVLNVRAGRNIEPGPHHFAGVYDGKKIALFIDGVPVSEGTGSGSILVNDKEVIRTMGSFKERQQKEVMSKQLELMSGDRPKQPESDYQPLASVWDGEDAELLEKMLDFYPRTQPHLILDATVNTGRFWRGSERPVIGLDIDAKHRPDVAGDNMNMPFRDDSFDVVVFDPPHIPNQGKDQSKDFNTRFGLVLKSPIENGYNFSHLYPPFAQEAYRVLKPEGILFCKIADYIHGHRFQWAHVEFIKAAVAVGFCACDSIVKIRKGPIISPRWKTAHHARRHHCYWLVFRKSDKCE